MWLQQVGVTFILHISPPHLAKFGLFYSQPCMVMGEVGGTIDVLDFSSLYTVFARSVAAATNVFNLSQREATIQERLLFESGVYLFDCALPQELNDYVMVFVNV